MFLVLPPPSARGTIVSTERIAHLGTAGDDRTAEIPTQAKPFGLCRLGGADIAMAKAPWRPIVERGAPNAGVMFRLAWAGAARAGARPMASE